MTSSYRTSDVCDTRKQAIAEGARFYWGKACKYGHGDGKHVKRYAGNTGCVECFRLRQQGQHTSWKHDKNADNARKAKRRFGDDPGKHALDDYLRAADTGEVKEVWDE